MQSMYVILILNNEEHKHVLTESEYRSRISVNHFVTSPEIKCTQVVPIL